ncbi:MAG TPA: cyclophilin-like family protein [Halobacteriales archaeon]|nr:cyclophilin-like family protein [Halobacteriales archaeon]
MAGLRIAVDGGDDAGGVELLADWIDDNPETRGAIEDALPLSGDAARWGDELYFRIPVDVPAEDARAEVPVGAVAYWPQGNALCLFWGPTPASAGPEPRAASPVNVVAEIEDVSGLASVEGGATVRIERA